MTAPQQGDVSMVVAGAATPAMQDRQERSRIEMVIPGTMLTYADTVRLATTLYNSGLLGRNIKSAQAAFAIIVAGAEMGLPPMLALRGISLVEGKPVLAADLQLGIFKRAGGRATWRVLTVDEATVYLVHPNGDTHTETWTWAMAVEAGLQHKDNWKKHRLAMMRSRAITAGLKSIGFEPLAGAYDPDEATHFTDGSESAEFDAQAERVAIATGADGARTEGEQRAHPADAAGGQSSASSTLPAQTDTPPSATTASSGQPAPVTDFPTRSAPTTDDMAGERDAHDSGPVGDGSWEGDGVKYPFGVHKGKHCNALTVGGDYLISTDDLERAASWLTKKANDTGEAKWSDWRAQVERVILERD